MTSSTLFLVTDDLELMQKARVYWEQQGVKVQVYSPHQWNEQLENGGTRERLRIGVPSLATGASPVDEEAKILPFPGTTPTSSESEKRVSTMNELESLAIQNAIYEYKGNLTEAARALGIGRATLYRKVKQYRINPSAARRKTAA